MKVLSLFDGMSCGAIAFKQMGVPIERYVAYEIDKYAVKTSLHNFPFAEHKGDVFTADFTEYEGFDYLIGGSPCTYWSIAQTKNRETEASGMGWELFCQYTRALHEAKPKYFLYENNKSMSKAIRQSICSAFGFEPHEINAALVSAQNRQRLYWLGKRQADGTYTRVEIEKIEDRGILLKDILDGYFSQDLSSSTKDFVLTASYDGAVPWNTLERKQRTMVAERIPNYGNADKGLPLSASYSHKGSGEGSLLSDCFPENPNKQVFDYVAEPINVCANDKAHTLKAGYYKQGMANFVTNGGFAATAVAVPLNITPEGKSQTIKAQYQQTSPANILGYTSTYGATGVAERVDAPICYELDPDSIRPDARRVGSIKTEKPNEHDSQAYRVYTTEDKSVSLLGSPGGQGKQTGLHTIPFEDAPPCFRVKEATLQGYTDIPAGECVDLAMPNSKTRRGRKMSEKSNCLTTSCSFYQYCGTVNMPIYKVENGYITIKEKQYPVKLVDGYYIIRKLTVAECMRLQTVPAWYEFPVSNAQAYKMLGNGWCVEVIICLLKATLEKKSIEEEIMDLLRG